jgi:hypothetical protein
MNNTITEQCKKHNFIEVVAAYNDKKGQTHNTKIIVCENCGPTNPLHRVVEAKSDMELFKKIWGKNHPVGEDLFDFNEDKFWEMSELSAREYASQFKEPVPISSNGWISVEDERKPDDDVSVIITDGNHVYVGGYGYRITRRAKDKKRWYMNNQDWDGMAAECKVTHWQPLPNKPTTLKQ